MPVKLYDTTLRDGAQGMGISYSLSDKLQITQHLAAIGIPYIEGGWPGSNPKDTSYFQAVKELEHGTSKIVAFGSTRHPNKRVTKDRQIQALLEAQTDVVAIVGKAWDLHVEQVLETDFDTNLTMIWETIVVLKERGKEVIFDAEHFFDGYRANPGYALHVLETAADAGADWLVLCDTNGGSMPHQIRSAVRAVTQHLDTPLGIHTHNDAELAVANALEAYRSGALMIQGTINGYGERCGNANLTSLIPTLQLKLGVNCIPAQALANLTHVSKTVGEIANMKPLPCAPYVGSAAFAHKGGIHVAAVEKNPASYEHIAPDQVGNSRQVLVSELSGRSNLKYLLERSATRHLETEVLKRIKEMEAYGYQFEAADASLELLVQRLQDPSKPPFQLIQAMVYSDRRPGSSTAEAMVKIEIDHEVIQTASSGVGPVHALDEAIRKALCPVFVELESVRLMDYKVRILDPDQATKAVTRVLVEAVSETHSWTTVGCGPDIIQASAEALEDTYIYCLSKISKGDKHVNAAC